MEKRKLSKAQIKKIWAIAGKRGIDSDELHKIVYGHTGKTSIRELTMREAERLCLRLSPENSGFSGGRLPWPRIQKRMNELQPNRIRRSIDQLTMDQVKLICILEYLLGWSENENRLEGWIRRIFRENREVGKMTKKEASLLIQSLSAANQNYQNNQLSSEISGKTEEKEIGSTPKEGYI